MALLTSLIILAIIIIIAIFLFRTAQVFLKIILTLIIVVLLYFFIVQNSALYEKFKGVIPEELPEQTVITQEECITQGGVYGPHGKRGTIFCNLPTSDAGKECLNDEDCEKLCILNETTTKGYCQSYEHQYGCFTTLQQGTPGPTICID